MGRNVIGELRALHKEAAAMFAPRIPITLANIETIKLRLAKSLGEVKSSHRVEAIARGLGFRTNASLRAAAKSAPLVLARADGVCFIGYLAEHDFAVSSSSFLKAVASVAIQEVLTKLPRLSMRGYGCGQPQRLDEGKWETPEQTYRRFLKDRAEFLADDAAEQFLLALAFVSRVQPIKTISQHNGSYGLKHIAESYSCTYPDGERLGPRYVANGALIAAAVHAGFRFKHYFDHLGYEAINVSFNMSKRSIEELDCEIRPDGPAAQDRASRIEARRNRMLGIYPF